MGFGQGLSGLRAQAQKLDVIGNNIANAGTVGFKSSTVSFADVYASSRVGLGTQVAAVNQNFGIGNITSTGGQFDMAIDGASGLFRLENANGSVVFSRNGEFSPNKDGYLANPQGQFLTGFVIDPTTGTYGLNPTPIRVPTGNIAARATGANVAGNPDSGVLAQRMNLDADAKEPAAAWVGLPAPPAAQIIDPDTYNISVPLTVYDSLGREHQLTQYFRKTDTDNEWEVYYQLDSEAPEVLPEEITFTTGGEIDTGGSGISMTFTIDGAEDLVVPFNYKIATQFGGGYNLEFQQDGYPTGEYASMSIAADGAIVANYTNGELANVGYVILANFPNLQGLQPVGGNAWIETATSGAAVFGRPGSNGLALIKGQALEESNVDIGAELVNMIITQRTYQANAQTISTQNEVMQTLINMR